MTHKRLKNYLKFGILFFIISLLNLGCQKDESLEPNEQIQEQNPFTINHINSNQISNNTKLALSLERLNAAKTKSNTNTENRTAHSEEHNFYIDTEKAVYIESQDGSYHSYTFLVQRNDEQTGLENLLLSLQEDGSYTAKLIKYNFEFYGTDGFLEALSNNHDNVHITPIDADGLTASLFARTTTSGVCFFITETSCSYGNHPGGYYANGNQCPGHHSHTRMECLGGGGQSGNSGTGDGSATTGSGETDSTTGGSGSTNGGTLGGNNNNDFTLPLTLSMAEQLSSFIDLTPEQEVWANKPQNEDNVQEIINYMLAGGDAEFASEATDAFINNGEVDFEENIIYDSSLNNYPCHKIVIQDAIGVCSPLTQGVLNAFEANDGTNLIFEVSNSIPGNGRTSQTSVYNPNTHTCNITIKIRQSYLETATDLSIARTVIHESLHALFVYMFEEGLLESEDGTPLDDFENLVEAHINYLSGLPANLGVAHHTLMAGFVEDIATSLSVYAVANGHTNSFSFYKKLAWGGLTHKRVGNTLVETDFFTQIIPSLEGRITIVNTIVAEQNNINTLTDGNGNIILPKGTPPNSSEPCD